MKVEALVIALEDSTDGRGRPHRYGTLLNDDLVGGGDFGDGAGAEFAVLDVGGTTGTDSLGFGGGVDGYEDDIGTLDFGFDVGGEEEVAAAGAFDDVEEFGFVDGEILGVPGIYLGLV